MSAQRRLMSRLIACLAAVSLSACTLKYGRIPDTASLSSSLRQNISTKADVLKVLGTPRGYGRADLGPPSEPQVLWFYEYLEASRKEFRLTMLVVFFHKELYTGHLWFSSQEKWEKTASGGRKPG
jgi:hypothetical protein